MLHSKDQKSTDRSALPFSARERKKFKKYKTKDVINMTAKLSNILFLTVLILAACAPTATLQPVLATATLEKQAPTAAFTPSPIPPTATPTISLPVDRSQPIPNVLPLTTLNISKLQPIATFRDAQLIRVFVPKSQDRAVAVFANGVQVYDLPDLVPKPFLEVGMWGTGEGRLTYNISSSGKYLAVITAEQYKEIQIWDLDTQKKACSFTFPARIDSGGMGPLIMEFFPETNRFLFSGIWGDGVSRADEYNLYNLSDCQIVFDLPPGGYHPEISSDGRLLAYQENAYQENAQIIVFNIDDKTESPIGEAKNFRGMGFSADSKSLIISYAYVTKMYDLVSGEVTNQFESNQGKDFVYIYPLEDGKRILLAQYKSNRIWDTAANTSFSLGTDYIAIYRDMFDDRNGALVTRESVWNLDQKNRVALTKYSNGRQLSALSKDVLYLAVDSGLAPYQTDLIDTSNGKIISKLPGERAPVAAEDGATFITSGDEQIFVHSFSSGELLSTIQGEYMNGLPIKDQQVLIWNATGNIEMLDVGKGMVLSQATLPIFPLDFSYDVPDYYSHPHSFPAWEDSLGYDPFDWLTSIGDDEVRISPDRATGVQQSGDQVLIFSITKNNLYPTSENLLSSYFTNNYFGFKFSPDGKRIIGDTNGVVVWDGQTGKLVKSILGKEYFKWARKPFPISPDGSKIFVYNSIPVDINTSLKSTLTILDIKTGTVVQSIKAPDCGSRMPTVVSADSLQVFTITPDCRIGLFNIVDWKTVKLYGSASGVSALALSPDGKLLAVGYGQTLEIWDVNKGVLLKSIKLLDTQNTHSNFALAFSPDGKLLAARYSTTSYWFQVESAVTLFGVMP